MIFSMNFIRNIFLCFSSFQSYERWKHKKWPLVRISFKNMFDRKKKKRWRNEVGSRNVIGMKKASWEECNIDWWHLSRCIFSRNGSRVARAAQVRGDAERRWATRGDATRLPRTPNVQLIRRLSAHGDTSRRPDGWVMGAWRTRRPRHRDADVSSIALWRIKKHFADNRL